MLLSKSIKLQEDTYWDSSSLNLGKVPVGEFILWEGNKVITDRSYITLGTFYSLKNCIENKFPVNGKRSAKICMEWNDSASSGGYIYLRLSQSGYSKEHLWPALWGNAEDGTRVSQISDFDYDSLPTGHILMELKSDASIGTLRLYKISLVLYDKPN